MSMILLDHPDSLLRPMERPLPCLAGIMDGLSRLIDPTTKILDAIKSGESQTITPEYTYSAYGEKRMKSEILM